MLRVENLCSARQPVLLAPRKPATIGRHRGRGVGTRGEDSQEEVIEELPDGRLVDQICHVRSRRLRGDHEAVVGRSEQGFSPLSRDGHDAAAGGSHVVTGLQPDWVVATIAHQQQCVTAAGGQQARTQ